MEISLEMLSDDGVSKNASISIKNMFKCSMLKTERKKLAEIKFG